jgi:hypothetical protein
MPNRWDNNPNSESGSAFHELIILPTVAPDLMRPYRVPGTTTTVATTPDTVVAQAQSNCMYHILVYLMSAEILQWQIPMRPSVTIARLLLLLIQASGFRHLVVPSESKYDVPVLLRLFFASVTIEWTERPKGWGGKAKRYNEMKPTPQRHAILRFSRVEFIIAALSAHGYEKLYEPGKKNGPAFKIRWAGSPYVCISSF